MVRGKPVVDRRVRAGPEKAPLSSRLGLTPESQTGGSQEGGAENRTLEARAVGFGKFGFIFQTMGNHG